MNLNYWWSHLTLEQVVFTLFLGGMVLASIVNAIRVYRQPYGAQHITQDE